jgi:hypothetical protein
MAAQPTARAFFAILASRETRWAVAPQRNIVPSVAAIPLFQEINGL